MDRPTGGPSSDKGDDTPQADVRMRGFRNRVTVAVAQQWVDREVASAAMGAEIVDLPNLTGRVLAEGVRSEVDVPGFARAMMDGYAIDARQTEGASSYNPLVATVVGQALPGVPYAQSVKPGEAVRIMTGAPMPDGANAVLPAELCQELSGETAVQVRLMGEAPPGKHVGDRGEDVSCGDLILEAGRRLRPQDIGLLSSIGRGNAKVHQRPRVRIVITGDELLPPGAKPRDYLIVDANGPMLAALVKRDGGDLLRDAADSRVKDQPEAILAALQEPADVVLVSGGSSVGQEDHAPVLLANHGELSIHGIAMRPSSPTGMGKLGAALVFLLPGNPVSCLCAYDFSLAARFGRWRVGVRLGRTSRCAAS